MDNLNLHFALTLLLRVVYMNLHYRQGLSPLLYSLKENGEEKKDNLEVVRLVKIVSFLFFSILYSLVKALFDC